MKGIQVYKLYFDSSFLVLIVQDQFMTVFDIDDILNFIAAALLVGQENTQTDRVLIYLSKCYVTYSSITEIIYRFVDLVYGILLMVLV